MFFQIIGVKTLLEFDLKEMERGSTKYYSGSSLAVMDPVDIKDEETDANGVWLPFYEGFITKACLLFSSLSLWCLL